eukprot:SAG11_NODE_1906_length_4084_cov_31.351568_2_plen_75_part_00
MQEGVWEAAAAEAKLRVVRQRARASLKRAALEHAQSIGMAQEAHALELERLQVHLIASVITPGGIELHTIRPFA